MTASNIIDGHQPMPNVLWSNEAECALSAFGASTGHGVLAKPEVYVTGKTVQNFRGDGIRTTNDGRVSSVTSRSNHVGIRLGSSDSLLVASTAYNNRDCNVWVAKDAGNCQIYGVHAYGSRISVYNEGGSEFQYVGGTIADSLVGAICNDQSTFIGTTFKQNTVVDALLRGGNCQLLGCTLNVQRETVEHNEFRIPGLPEAVGKIGAYFAGGGGGIRGGSINLLNWIHPQNTKSGRAATAVFIDADDCTVETKIVDQDGIDGNVAFCLMGKRKGLNIDTQCYGFHAETDELLQMDPMATYINCDITLRCDGLYRKLASYIPERFTGVIRIKDGGRSVEARN